MSTSEKPMGKKRALLVAVNQVKTSAGPHTIALPVPLPKLPWAHRDARLFKDRLIALYSYEEEDVILMLDDAHHPKHLWPTRKNIVCGLLVPEMLEFSQGSDSCDKYVVCRSWSSSITATQMADSGHGLQEACPHDEEADGNDEEIVAADGKPILDDILHNGLIAPLKTMKGSKLFALFDCCHSETLLDLQYGKGPNKYSRTWKVGIGQMFKGIATAIVQFLRLSKTYCKPINYCPPMPTPESENLSSTLISDINNATSPEVSEETQNLSVICFSACRDNQIARDDNERQLTFTKCFLDANAARPDMSWQDLRNGLEESINGIGVRYQQSSNENPVEGGQRPIWAQEPRCSTTPHTDLTKKMDL
ncbi:hypothetical protein BU15DRAFT_79206 [Melanogaster broomeanus]|nr:hypothetical protein BU15DRAFT_79206 [Melanogaster broomeanus]